MGRNSVDEHKWLGNDTHQQKKIDVWRLDASKVTAIEVPDKLLPIFRVMIHRAVNLWPDAPPEIKHFADIITNGKPMQDYFIQRDFKPVIPNKAD